jgi:hypothetical protein
LEPAQATPLGQLLGEDPAQLEEVVHVGHRVGALVGAEGAAEPIGQAVALGQVHAHVALGQGRQRRQRVAHEPGGELRVEQRPRQHTARQIEHLEVLGGGVHHHHGRSGQGVAEGTEVHRQRIHQDPLVGPGHLHQGQLGVVGLLPVELGVDRVRLDRPELLDQRRELVGPHHPPDTGGRLAPTVGVTFGSDEPHR